MQFKEWLLFVESKQEKTLALELAGDAFQELNSVIPQNKRETDPLLLLAAYFYNKQKNLNQIKIDIQDYANLVKNQKMPLINVNLQNKSPDKPFDDYLHWTQIIHGHQGEERNKQDKKSKPTEQDFQNEIPIKSSPDGLIKVYKSNSPQQCIILGKGQTFCISQPGNTMWKSYRDNKGSTFYFVYDDTREDELSIVVVDASNNGIELTDKKNTTGTILDPFTGERTTNSNSYIEYLKEKGIDTSIFKNIFKTEEEIAEDKKLGRNNKDLNWFIALSFTEKSNYIGRGHLLTDEQFDYLWKNRFPSLLEQYAKTGLKLTDYQIDKIASNADLRKNYIHNRMITLNDLNHINEKELQYLNKEQINKLPDDNVKYLLHYAKDKDEMANILGSENINKLTDYNVYYLLNYAKDKDEMAKTLGSENINKLSDNNVYSLLQSAKNKDEMANFIINNKKELTYDNVYNLLKYAKNKDEIAKILGSENINKFSDDNVENLLLYAKDKDAMATLIINNKKELTDNNVENLLQYAKDKDKMATLILQYKKELTANNVYSLLSYAKDKDVMANFIINNKEELTANNVYSLLLFAKDKDAIANLLGLENINKLTDETVYVLLREAINKDEIAKILGSENINKLSDDNINDLIENAENQDEMATLIINNKKELTDNNVYFLLVNANKKDKIANLIINNKKELTANNVKVLLYSVKDKDKIAKILGAEKINKLTDNDVLALLKNAKNKDEMKKILQQYGRI